MRLYRSFTFFIVCQLWPRIRRQRMWYMTMKPSVSDESHILLIQEKEK